MKKFECHVETAIVEKINWKVGHCFSTGNIPRIIVQDSDGDIRALNLITFEISAWAFKNAGELIAHYVDVYKDIVQLNQTQISIFEKGRILCKNQ